MKKHDVLDVLERLPEPIDPDQLMDELYVKMKIERAEEAVAEGRVVAHQAVVERSREGFE